MPAKNSIAILWIDGKSLPPPAAAGKSRAKIAHDPNEKVWGTNKPLGSRLATKRI